VRGSVHTSLAELMWRFHIEFQVAWYIGMLMISSDENDRMFNLWKSSRPVMDENTAPSCRRLLTWCSYELFRDVLPKHTSQGTEPVPSQYGHLGPSSTHSKNCTLLSTWSYRVNIQKQNPWISDEPPPLISKHHARRIAMYECRDFPWAM